MTVTNRAPADDRHREFWSEVFALHGSVTPLVAGRVAVFGGIAACLYLLNEAIRPNLGIDLGPYEVAGAVLGFFLVFRTNAGYDRWYEGRRLMGLIGNHSRNLAITAVTHGPMDSVWRETMIRWIASFGHVTRATLRGESVPEEVTLLLGQESAGEIGRAAHMPTFVAYRIGELFRSACEDQGMDRIAFLQADNERMQLIESEGGCERIRGTPIPVAYSINIRRLIFLYLVAIPFALLDHLHGIEWLSPLVMMLIAYPILAMDQIGAELEKPFATQSLNHLPLDQLTRQTESELLALLAASKERR